MITTRSKISYGLNKIPLLLFLLLFGFGRKKTSLEIVKVDGGLISGTRSADGDVMIYKGIPFAAPPVGDLRWKAPQAVEHWKGVKKCEAFGPSPMQGAPVPFSMWSQEFLIPKEPISEDCLYLNVWTGARSDKERRAVLVYIYGGGFASGGSGVPIYDGTAMAKKGIVFVSINYRVGVFGFFAHPELSKESGHDASGNYGLMDQIAALKWVKRNIASFGGDPARVTIAGQSAGSMSVNCLVASPEAKGLFVRAVGESGANFSNNMTRIRNAEEEGVKLAVKLNANSIAALRSIPAEELFKKGQGSFRPIVDGYVLPQTVSAIYDQHKENKVDLLTGWNEEEGLLFGPVKNAHDFQSSIEKQYGNDAKIMLRYYPASNDQEAASSQMKLSRDQIFGVQNYTWANRSGSDHKKVFVYRFTRKVPATGEYVKYGAFHTGEVPYAYGNLQFVDRPWEPVDHKLADMMSSYWTNFAKKGDPNGPGLPIWPSYNSSSKNIMDLGVNTEAKALPDAETLDFLYRKINK